jgi:hypothetical protein
MMTTDGLGHFRGSRPRSPTPRVTICLMYASAMPERRTASSVTATISLLDIGMVSQIALAES